ncbi:MAG: bidirectional hydrogenase complex protein HoxE [Caldilinea sp.]|nr:bidirectional hydrogenase complex protein HoxE [Caldilinea sp.]MCB0067531.1 bidirectional hydrogenase complex protein HoxE [Caldilineaceae bacterium]MCB0038632.1 bidirectional hydrogenase complex protein HoxE [Caldilinea sp.]MCB0048997.1 bidirectional hydrogenase complex protein HoxE [Caldilinea sp.]MCB0150266.1 bidirectional hydrogenase complex protein HoxE [Caldilineaceae bacterium]
MSVKTGPPSRTRQRAAADHPSGDPRFSLIDRTLKRFSFQQDALIEVLHTAQESFGYLSDDLLIYVAHQLKLPLSWVYGVATFYHFFTLTPQGEHNCIVCMGTACYVKRAAEIVAALQQEYGVNAGETTRDGALSLSTARCLGSCGLAPVLVLDGEVLPRETPESTLIRVRERIAGGGRGSSTAHLGSNGANGNGTDAEEE